MKRQSLQIGCLLFGSGMCALVYQTTWLREFRMIFGASTAASAAVLAIFMGGLGLGSWLLGKRADRAERPLEFYGNLELLISASAAITPILLLIARWVYTSIGGTSVLGDFGGTALRLILSMLVLSIPTIAMGGTLPAAARAAETDNDDSRRNLAILYGMNTLGAVTGASLSTFFLFETFGNRRTLLLACLVNALVGLTARVIARRLADDQARVIEAASEIEGESQAAAAIEDEAPADQPERRQIPVWFVLGASAVVGFVFLLMEIVWYRMLGPILGGSSFTFGLILAVALFGIGIGGGAYAILGGRRQATIGMFALTCALEAVFIAGPFALGDRIAILAALLRPLGNIGFSGHVLAWILISAIVLLPAAFIAGVQFPLLISLLGRGRKDVGTHVGYAYTANTIGAILGSLVGGFGILPLLTAPGTWRLSVVILGLLGAAAIAVDFGPSQRFVRHVPTAIALVLALAMLASIGPTAAWRHSPIGAGRVDLTTSSINEVHGWVNTQRREVGWEADGRESSVALATGFGYAFMVNGKVDGHARGDAPTQVMSGLLGAMIHPNPTSAMVIGLGTGSTAGWLGTIPTIERVDAVELEPAILRIADDCAPVNQNVLHNPKVHISIGDAREVLITTPRRYDVIFSEPSNPYRAGVASLYTQDFYRSAIERLTDDGIFIQWVQTYEVDGQTIRTIMATLASEFPSVEVWQTQPADLLLVASKKPLVHDVARLRERIAQEPYRSALLNVFRTQEVEGVFARFVARDSLVREILRQEGDALNTDDRNLVEFDFARSVGKSRTIQINDILGAAESRGESTPEITGGTVDWGRTAQMRVSAFVVGNQQPVIAANMQGEQLAKAQVKRSYVAGRFGEAAGIIKRAELKPDDLVELELFAESLADVGDESAVAYIDQLRPFFPIEADAFVGILRTRQGRFAEATDAFVAAYTAYRTDPWPLSPPMEHALAVTSVLVTQDPTATSAQRIAEAIDQPFVMAMINANRLETRLRCATVLDRSGYGEATRALYRSFEPNPIWTSRALLTRLDCYRALGDPLAAQALRDVETFAANESVPFSQGLVDQQ